MVALISVSDAKQQLLIEHDEQDAFLAAKAEEATDIVIGYLKKPNHGWTEETAPPRVRSAILLVLGVLYRDREGQTNPLTDAVKALLWRDRDPALA
ncbi:head-tail connector protein [Enterovirga aerilata]|uniref:Phage gp6-like head-tail connector protein n=1 Tax=Enterovirga aerilata TaxID=2730920 RepID=A0A849IF25_9HYPH|nr:head-tail connector protein [Enterovirga sp. DB1703]NNM75049.1 phage gp6-like head-tail connector protein [Enterovirga sp. DB1703]